MELKPLVELTDTLTLLVSDTRNVESIIWGKIKKNNNEYAYFIPAVHHEVFFLQHNQSNVMLSILRKNKSVSNVYWDLPELEGLLTLQDIVNDNQVPYWKYKNFPHDLFTKPYITDNQKSILSNIWDNVDMDYLHIEWGSLFINALLFAKTYNEDNWALPDS